MTSSSRASAFAARRCAAPRIRPCSVLATAFLVFSLTGLAVTGLPVGGLSPTAAVAAGPESITVVSWGGAYTKSQVEAYHKPFTAETDIAVNSVNYKGGLDELRAQVAAGEIAWDVIDLVPADAALACQEGLIAKLDPAALPAAVDGTPASEDFVPGTLHDCGVGGNVWSMVYAYSEARLNGSAPRKIGDLFDLESFPGKRGLRKSPRANLEWALMADGVPSDQIYETLRGEEGVDRAFSVLERIKEEIVWWEAGAQPPQLLADGEVIMSSAYSDRLINAITKEGQSFVVVWDGQIWDIDYWAVVKDSPKRESGLAFVQFASRPQRIADQTKWISHGPVRKSALALVPKDLLSHMPTHRPNFRTAFRNDSIWWAAHQDDLEERFAAWLEP